MAVDLFANQVQTTITAGGTTAPAQGTSESWTPASASGFPTASPAATPPTQFRITDPALPSEKIIVTDSRTTPWTVTRGGEGTAPVAHAPGFTVQHVVTAGVFGGFLQSANGPLMPPSFDRTGYDQRQAPVFTRFADNPGLTLTNYNPSGKASHFSTPAAPTSLFSPWWVNAAAVAANNPSFTPLDNWYFYATTNHDAAQGGVYLWTAPALDLAQLTFQGLCWQDTSTGFTQTENVAVIWNDDTGLFHMYNKVLGVGNGGGMVTRLQTSATGLFSLDSSATALGTVIDIPAANLIPGTVGGQALMAYGRPFRIGRRWGMHMLFGGATPPTFGLAWSADGISWQLDGKPLLYGFDQIIDSSLAPSPLAVNAIRIEWNSGNIIRWRGDDWWFGLLSNFIAGVAAKNARMACAPITSRYRTLTGRPMIFGLPTVGANESVNYQGFQAISYLGRVYVTYVCDYANFNMMVSQ